MNPEFNKTLKQSILIVLFFLSLNIINAQWIYPELDKLKTDVIISYDVIYERSLTPEEKKSLSYFNDISIAFNKEGLLKEKRFYSDISINHFILLDYKKENAYSCSISGEKKTSIKSDFKLPKKEVDLISNETKNIVGINCNKATIPIQGVTKDIYYSKELGLRYCKSFNVDGFLLEYPGYNKQLGHYKVVAKTIQYNNLEQSFFSLAGFNITEREEYMNLSSEKKRKFQKTKRLQLDKKASRFNADSMDEKKLSSKKMLGEVVVLNFWFTTCPPCKREIPSLNKLKEKYKGENVNFIAVALDTEYKLDEFLSKKIFNYDIVADGKWLANKFSVISYPTNIVIDKEGVVKLYEIGYKHDIIKRMSYEIDQALEK